MLLTKDELDKLRQALIEEGEYPWMYPDKRGLVSTAQGFLIDASGQKSGNPWDPALSLPWQNVTPENTVEKEWKKIKGMKEEGKKRHGGTFDKDTTLRLPPGSLRPLFDSKARGIQSRIKTWWILRDFDSFPADAQFGLLVRAWAALQPTYKLCKAACERDWMWAAEEAPWPDIVPTRRETLLRLFRNAAVVEADNSYDRQKVYWPQSLGTPPSTPRIAFRTTVRSGDWNRAFEILNGLWIRDMLQVLDSLETAHRNALYAMKNHMRIARPELNWVRMEFALYVVYQNIFALQADDYQSSGRMLQVGQGDQAEAMQFSSFLRRWRSGK